MNVKPRLTQYTDGACGSPPVNGSRIAIAAPSAAICASDRSTKMTPRSTTCTPRYAWMPVRMRLATKGAARNASIAESMVSSLRLGADFLQRADEQVDVIVEQLEIVGDFLDAADRWRHHEDLGA